MHVYDNNKRPIAHQKDNVFSTGTLRGGGEKAGGANIREEEASDETQTCA